MSRYFAFLKIMTPHLHILSHSCLQILSLMNRLIGAVTTSGPAALDCDTNQIEKEYDALVKDLDPKGRDGAVLDGVCFPCLVAAPLTKHQCRSTITGHRSKMSGQSSRSNPVSRHACLMCTSMFRGARLPTSLIRRSSLIICSGALEVRYLSLSPPLLSFFLFFSFFPP